MRVRGEAEQQQRVRGDGLAEAQRLREVSQLEHGQHHVLTLHSTAQYEHERGKEGRGEARGRAQVKSSVAADTL